MSSTGPRLVYRAPADVRAIPNATWDGWLGSGAVPWAMFSPERWTQRTLREIVRATCNRRRA